jgi:hypothetical protein
MLRVERLQPKILTSRLSLIRILMVRCVKRMVMSTCPLKALDRQWKLSD